MTNDSITRLLYAILSQKCLKDIDWNKVARDPILSQEITNGHAARMRYSRFKKQMDGTSAVRKPRNPSSSPRKPKVEKNKSPKKVKERKNSDDGDIKAEAGESQDTQIEGTPEAGTPIDPHSHHGSPAHMVKREPGHPSGYPLTPMGSQSQSHSPSPGFGEMDGMNEMMASFGMPGHEQALYHHHHQGVGVMVDADPRHVYGNGMGMHMGIADPFVNEGQVPWYQQQGREEGHAPGVLVKREPRWEEAYRQV